MSVRRPGPVRGAFTIVETIVAAVLLVVILGFVFMTVTRGTRIAGASVSRMGTAQAVLALRTNLQRDLPRAGSISHIMAVSGNAQLGDPPMLTLSIPGTNETVRYFVLRGDLYRQQGTPGQAGVVKRIGRNFHGEFLPSVDPITRQVIIEVVGTGPSGAANPGAPRFLQGYTAATAETHFGDYFRNWVVPPPNVP